MIRAFVIGSLILSACAMPSGPGSIRLDIAYEQPPPETSQSIGGYGVFARLTDSAGTLIRGGLLESAEVIADLVAGDYQLAVEVKSASDSIPCNRNHECVREFLGTAATCEATIRVELGSMTPVQITAFGEHHCIVAIDN